MHLRSITMKGFKSFPNRTRLEFGQGVSVIVGPNGSGKSNVTDAVLWALGEQSPLAVRGQTMRDVVFAGGHGVKGSTTAEVEVVIDNHDQSLASEFSEISIVRRLALDGEGEYRLNGARCRLVDVLEVLSDSGLGKEMHSVVSQGKVEAIVLSRPRERRLLIEEAAGLGKHRKRRRRAQLKLERTEENLARALDVEREARSRLRPLKRQAEAAQLHERLERQSLEARLELAQDDVRGMRLELGAAEARAAAARGRRDEAERLLAAVAERREAAEQSFASQGAARERLQARLFAARSAADRITMRLERANESAEAARERGKRRRAQLELLEGEASGAAGAGGAADESASDDPAGRVEALEAELAALEAGREGRLAEELSGLEDELRRGEELREGLEGRVEQLRAELEGADRRAEDTRSALREAERAVDAARAETARAGAELAAVNQFVRGSGAAPEGARSLAEGLHVEPGYELALAAALGPLLGAGLVEDLRAGQELLDAAGDRGATAVVSSRARGRPAGHAPQPGAQRLLARLSPERGLKSLAERLLADVWVVESLDGVSAYFDGVAVTREGRLLDAATGALAQAPAGGADRLLAELGRRGDLVAASEAAAEREHAARAAMEAAAGRVGAADRAREEAEVALRRGIREAQEAGDAVARWEWEIARRREAPEQGPDAVRRAELAADLRAERRLAERIERERAERLAAIGSLRLGAERDAAVVAGAERAAGALSAALDAVGDQRERLEAEVRAGAAAGEHIAATLRACAHEEAELQGRLREASEAVTEAEVAAQQVRDAAGERERELAEVLGRLGLAADSGEEAREEPSPLPEERRAELAARIERLARRREQLGPVNPLAAREYEEALAHVEELEGQRSDLEAALAELEGLIRETDRRIRDAFEQTFESAARNFEEVVGHLFPGGRGRLRLVRAEQGPRPVIGDAAPEAGEDASEEGAPETDEDGAGEAPEAGVEVEVTPAGKATRRLSLLSGGEKSLVALAFMFAVFLARPCPFYILDEVEAALDDVNIDRFLELVRRYSDRAQFIVVTHQKRTMDAADTLYGISMGGDGISRVLSRRLAGAPASDDVQAASA